MSTYVIAISGPSGAGKSTLIEQLVNLLGDAVALGIDDYTETSIYPPDTEWLAGGAFPDDFKMPQLDADIRTLRQGGIILHPQTRAQLGPVRFVVMEEPFGRSRTEMRSLVDFHVQLGVPLEIALTRRIQRSFLSKVENPAEALQRLDGYLEWYLRAGRLKYIAVRNLASKDSDLVVDGTLPPEVIAQKILDAIKGAQE